MKKGFTLIELLAVIVLIAVIAVITVPIIGNVIDKARLGALKSSAYGLIEAGTLYNAQNQNENDARFDIINGIQTTTEDKKLKYKGNVENGTVVVAHDGKIMVCLNSGNYKAYKDFNENEVTAVKKANPDDVCTVSLDENNNTILDKTPTGVKNVYPVGSIYMSVDDTNPHDLFGGEWEKIEDKFLLSSGSNYSLGSTGGNSSVSYTPQGVVGDHTLTIAEMPSHTHRDYSAGVTGQEFMFSGGGGPWVGWNGTYTSGATGGNQPHNHPFTGTKTTIETMPPYVVVNIWKRTA